MEERTYITKMRSTTKVASDFSRFHGNILCTTKEGVVRGRPFSSRSVVVIQDFGLAEGSFIARGPCIKYQF